MDVTTLSCSPYVPNYFTPGPDVSAYAVGVDLLQKRGFTEIERPISMRAELTGYREDATIAERRKALEADGVEIRPVTPLDIVPLLEFIRANFSADWHREASGVLNDLYNGDGRTVGMVIARKGETVLGYAEHRNERYGPFGVREDQRGNGIGRVLAFNDAQRNAEKELPRRLVSLDRRRCRPALQPLRLPPGPPVFGVEKRALGSPLSRRERGWG